MTNSDSKDQKFEQDFYPLKIVQPFAWLGIVAVVVGLGGGLTWAIFGTIRESVSTIGVVTYPGGLRQIFSSSTERIERILLKPQDHVKKGQTVATLLADTQLKKIEAANQELEEFEAADAKLQNLVSVRVNQADSTQSQLQSVYKPLADEAEKLFSQRLITASNYGLAKKNFLNTRQNFLEQITDLRTLRRSLDVQIIEKKANLKQLKSQLRDEYYVNSPIDGKIININYQTGDYPSNNVPLATVVADSALQYKENNIVVATAKSGDIDKLSIGDYALFTPDNVERNRFGGIVAKVLKVQRSPITPEFLVNNIGSKQIANKLTSDEKLFYMQLSLKADKDTPTGFRWSSGSGPDKSIKIFPNLLGKTTIYYQKRAPITYVMPFIRQLIGLQDNPQNK